MKLTSKNIRDLFTDKIFNHSTIQNQTAKIFDYDVEITTDNDLTFLRYQQKINFYSFQVLRSINYEITSNNGNANDYGYDYEILINYFLEAENKRDAYNLVIDRLEALDDLIHSTLGIRWNDNVDLFRQSQIDLPQIESIQNVECWKMSVLYTGLKYN